jgi:protein-disulfide isomerase
MTVLQRLVPLIVALSLAACSGEGLPSLQGSTGPETGSSALGQVPVTQDKAAAFNPFSGGQEPVGGREVIEKPTLADVMLTGTLPEMSWGRPDAPVTVIKYASLTCPHCRKFQLDVWPQVKREFVDTGKIRFIIREFPIGRASGTATVALRCAPADKYLALYEKFLAQQGSWVSQEVRSAEIVKVAAQVGVTGPQFEACLKDKPLLDGLNWVKERGRKLGIIGTPNFFVNARLVKTTLDLEGFRKAVADAQAQASVPTR